MPEKFPLEDFYRTNQPGPWFEYWQDEDFFFGHPDSPDEPTDVQLEASHDYEMGPIGYGWPDPDFGEEPYKLF